MKLQKISLCDFRAFPGPGEYVFDFGKKPHMLIYGENGSGKTSVFKALLEFFNLHADAVPFLDCKNYFSDAAENVSLICGKVGLTFREELPAPLSRINDVEKVWSFVPTGQPDNRQRSDTTVAEVARRKGLLDYQALLKANLSETDRFGRTSRPNLFRLFVEQLLGDLEVVQALGKPTTVGELWNGFQKTAKNNQYFRGNALSRVTSAQKKFNDSMVQALPMIKQRADNLLSKYFQHPVELSFTYIGANFLKQRKPGSRGIDDGKLYIDLTFRGRSFNKYEEVLNEAKLTAVALCIYFAALLDGIPKGVSGYPRLLVLDDVLIGLDMQNRLPVLNLLRDEFSANDWQIILLTHDKVWYDYAIHAAMGLDWACYELYADRVPDGAGNWYDFPLLRTAQQGAGDYLQRAKEQMRLHDHKSAGMYARAAYELTLKKFCDKRHLQLPFFIDANKISSDKFFKAAKCDVNDLQRQVSGIASPVPLVDLNVINSIFSEIELHRKQVLNPMSHAPVTPLTSIEVQAAIESVEKLIDGLDRIKK
ncbi:MAG TPA: AAA family ATPase [Burkholderiaceae bacterium]|nr:AAA family ATPase [Burkholderiaceae bacterium]